MSKYNIVTITIDDFKELIANGDDTHDNQIRIRKNGEVFLSQDTVGADDLDDIAFRFETFDALNDYVGKAASQDEKFVTGMFNAMKENWEKGSPMTYLDNWR